MVEIKKIAIALGALCFLGVLAPHTLRAQQRNPLPGMEKNEQYQALLTQEKQLYHLRDSINGQIDAARKLFSEDSSSRQKYGQQILSLENELYDVRNRIGGVANSIGVLEQEYIARSMSEADAGPPAVPPGGEPTVTAPPAVKQSANLVYNPYFKEQLPKADYSTLVRAQEQEIVPLELIATYFANYKIMDSLGRVYSEAERKVAEEAYSKLQTLRGINARLSDSLAQVWGYIFDNKTYTYTYLLDKMNKSDLLSGFEKQFRTLNGRIASGRDTVASEAVYGYPLRKALVLDYEYTLAGLLGYTAARDSIATVQRSISALNFALRAIEPAPRNFIQYSDILTTASPYNASKPIPEAELFRYGTVFRIQLGIFQRPQPISLFRGVHPLSYEKLEDGRYRYSAGALRSLEEAQVALEQMKRIGFRQPQIVVWRDGVFESLDGSAPGASSKGGMFRIEIEGAGNAMSDRLKDLLEESAPDKEISRATNDRGEYVYTVGTFDSREAAQEVVVRLNEVETISAKILVLE